jgi:hypothetical protein
MELGQPHIWPAKVVATVDAPAPTLPWADGVQQKSKDLQQAEAESARATEKARASIHEELAKLQSAKDRLDGYLLPRVAALSQPSSHSADTTLSLAALVMAMNRSDADWQAFMAQAKTGHADDGLVARVRACADPNWLPF